MLHQWPVQGVAEAEIRVSQINLRGHGPLGHEFSQLRASRDARQRGVGLGRVQHMDLAVIGGGKDSGRQRRLVALVGSIGVLAVDRAVCVVAHIDAPAHKHRRRVDRGANRLFARAVDVATDIFLRILTQQVADEAAVGGLQTVYVQQRLEICRQTAQQRGGGQFHTLAGLLAGRVGVIVRQRENLPARQGRHLGIGRPFRHGLATDHGSVTTIGVQPKGLDVATVIRRLVFGRVLVLIFQRLEFAAIARHGHTSIIARAHHAAQRIVERLANVFTRINTVRTTATGISGTDKIIYSQ
ncbi:hypothetical protein D3C87_1086690 [compost metagenome]